MARPKAGTTFWDRVTSQLRLAENGCHEFTGHLDECGYGRIYKDGKLIRIHRAKWELYNGPLQNGLQVLHKCDNPCCINIKHLFTGTHNDNMRDRLLKDRCAKLKGTLNGSAKLDEEKVSVIKTRLRRGDSCYSIDREYGVTGETILHIKHGRHWKHVT